MNLARFLSPLIFAHLCIKENWKHSSFLYPSGYFKSQPWQNFWSKRTKMSSKLSCFSQWNSLLTVNVCHFLDNHCNPRFCLILTRCSLWWCYASVTLHKNVIDLLHEATWRTKKAHKACALLLKAGVLLWIWHLSSHRQQFLSKISLLEFSAPAHRANLN